MLPPTPAKDGKVIDALPTVTSGCPFPYVWSWFGSYATPICVAVTRSAPGMVTLRLATLSVNAPGTLNAARSADGSLIAPSALSRSIWRLNVPTMPVSCALAPPKSRLALSSPIAIVSVSLPLLNEVSASVIEPPLTLSGPSVTASSSSRRSSSTA